MEIKSKDDIIWTDEVEQSIRIRAQILTNSEDMHRTSPVSPPICHGVDQVIMVDNTMYDELISGSCYLLVKNGRTNSELR